jgi:hypothetical protein
MSDLAPEKLSASLFGAAATSQADDLEAMIARLDNKWGQLKKLLRVQEQADALEPPDGGSTEPEAIQRAAGDAGLSESEGHESEWHMRVDLSPLEANAIVEGMEKLGEDARVLKRLVRLERQNRGLTCYAIFCTFLLLGLLFSTLLLEDNAASPTETLKEDLRPPVAAGPMALGPPALPLSGAHPYFQVHGGFKS